MAQPTPAGRRGGQDRLQPADYRRPAGAGLRPLLRHLRVRHRPAAVRVHRRRPHGRDPLGAQSRHRAGRARRLDGAGLAAQGSRPDFHAPGTPVPGGAGRLTGHAVLAVFGRLGAARTVHRERGARVRARQEPGRPTGRSGVAVRLDGGRGDGRAGAAGPGRADAAAGHQRQRRAAGLPRAAPTATGHAATGAATRGTSGTAAIASRSWHAGRAPSSRGACATSWRGCRT